MTTPLTSWHQTCRSMLIVENLKVPLNVHKDYLSMAILNIDLLVLFIASLHGISGWYLKFLKSYSGNILRVGQTDRLADGGTVGWMDRWTHGTTKSSAIMAAEGKKSPKFVIHKSWQKRTYVKQTINDHSLTKFHGSNFENIVSNGFYRYD